MLDLVFSLSVTVPPVVTTCVYRTRLTSLPYLGELGWELYVAKENMASLYDSICEAGREFGMEPFGKYALDSLRQEKGLRGWGNEVRHFFVFNFFTILAVGDPI